MYQQRTTHFFLFQLFQVGRLSKGAGFFAQLSHMGRLSHAPSTITGAADPVVVAGGMTEQQRRTASRAAVQVLVSYTHDSYDEARTAAMGQGPTLAGACFAQAECLFAWWQRADAAQAAAVREGWERICAHVGYKGEAVAGEQGAVFVLATALHRLAHESGLTADTLNALPYTDALPLLQDTPTTVRMVIDFVVPPALEPTGVAVKRLAHDSPAFAALALWAEAICIAHARDCPFQHDPAHVCRLSDRAAALAS